MFGKKKLGIFFILLLIMAICVFGGMKLGQYMAYRVKKPRTQSSSLSGITAGGKSGTVPILTESETVQMTSMVCEFINAEHRKRNDILSGMVDHDYYSTFLREIKPLTSGSVTIQDIDYTEIGTDRVEVEVTFMQHSKKKDEKITLVKKDKEWKVNDVER